MDMDYDFVAKTDEVPVGTYRCFDVDGRKILVAHLDDGFHAVENRCTHAGQSFDGSPLLKGGLIVCPLHGARFDLRTGAPRTAPAFLKLPVYPVRVADGSIAVKVPKRPPPLFSA
jgi:3-phenylpropionate/trans-cinnamate dioxygenase ferredoxin subunit